MNRVLTSTISTIEVSMKFQEWLSEQMKAGGYTDSDLATLIGMDRKTILAWRLGQRSPKLDQLARIAQVFRSEFRIGGKDEDR